MRLTSIFRCGLVLGALFSFGSRAQFHQPEARGAERVVSTFSIVAADPAAQEVGVAVQSRAFRAGAIVPWARGGIGAVATQAEANLAFGPAGLRMLAQGAAPADVIQQLIDGDAGREGRQVAVVDASGRVAAFTGAKCLRWAGHFTGEHYSVQGNILAGEHVARAMANGFERASGSLSERLMAALEAGQRAGGDVRGMQAGAILVVRGPARNDDSSDRVIDVRVDDHPNAISELRRLLNISLAGRHAGRAWELAAQGKYAEAIAEQKLAIAMDGQDAQRHYAMAAIYARSGDADNAIASLKHASRRNRIWLRLAADQPYFAGLRENRKFRNLIDK